MRVYLSRAQFLIAVFLAGIFLTSIAFGLLHVVNQETQRTCESSLRVRQPLENYITSVLRLEREVRVLRPPQGPPRLRELEAQSLRNLADLRAALATATASGCTR